MNPKYITTINDIPMLSRSEKQRLTSVEDMYGFRANDYYLSLIDWSDPDDPIRRIIIPHEDELIPWGSLDASNEKEYTVVPGLEHKYDHTVILLISNVCGGCCRFCFRKRIFMTGGNDISRDVSEGIAYIEEHPEINNVLLSGGDPLLLSTPQIERILERLRKIDHVRLIRFGSKMPAFNPFRILNDPSLLEVFNRYSRPDSKIYIMTHFNHPRELTEQSLLALHMLHKSGVELANQTPLINGVNDNPEVLADLFDALSFAGVPPYYVFQCRPTQGNRHLSIPIEMTYTIHEQARMRCSGLGKRSRLTMSHSTGKLQIAVMTGNTITFKYLRAANPLEKGMVSVFRRNPDAYWFDDYTELIDRYAPSNPFLNIAFDFDELEAV